MIAPPAAARLTLARVDAEPSCVTLPVHPPDQGVLSPLARGDEEDLRVFFERLGDRSRRFYSVENPRAMAREHCDAIARYDKLRLVLRRGGPILGLVEFSFGLPEGDVVRFEAAGCPLDAATDCRWGLCVADDWQRRGVGTALAAASFTIAARFGRPRILLFGGVRAANEAAIAFYRSVGFCDVAPFDNDEGIACLDMIRDMHGRAADDEGLADLTPAG